MEAELLEQNHGLWKIKWDDWKFNQQNIPLKIEGILLWDDNTNDIVLPHFIMVQDNWIFIDLDLINSWTEFVNFINEVFREHYFKDLDYTTFSKLIFDFEWYKKDHDWKIQIASNIEKFDNERRKKYQRPTNFNKYSAEYTFSTMYDTIEINWKLVEVEFIQNIDEFISAMWWYGIKFWLKIEEIQKKINLKQNERIIIAEYEQFIKWIDSKLLTLVNLWLDFELKTKTWWFIDLKWYKRVFPQIKAWTRIYQKIDLVPWCHWMNILWEEIRAPEVKDIKIESLIETEKSWVKIVREAWVQFIEAEIDGYVVPIQWNYNSQKIWEDESHLVEVQIWEIKSKVKITKEINLWIIWPDTWNIETYWELEAKWISSWYYVKANKSTIKWEITWCLSCINNIEINWNVTWWEHFRKEKIWAETIQDWKIVSNEWNISIKWNLYMKSFIQALKWDIDLVNSELSIVIWKNIKVKNATKTIFIWDNIEVDWICTDCVFICTNSINAKNFQTTTNNENTIFILKPVDYQKEWEEYSKKIGVIKEKISQIQIITEQITKENDEILNDKRFKWYQIYKNKLEENKNWVTEEIKKLLTQNQEWYEWQINKLTQNNAKIAKVNDILSGLENNLDSLNIEFFRIIKLSNSLVKPRVVIRLNRWELKILALDLSSLWTIEKLSLEVISQLADFKNLLTKKSFDFSLIHATSSSSVDFEYK